MRKFRRIWCAAILFSLCTAVALAQAGPGPRGARNYNPATETTLTGTVEDVVHPTGNRGGMGTHLMLKTDSGTFDVHVGPTAYLEQQQFTFAKGDKIEVTGSKVQFGGKDALIAREIKKDGKTLVLRNAQGIPQWSRRGQPNP